MRVLKRKRESGAEMSQNDENERYLEREREKEKERERERENLGWVWRGDGPLEVVAASHPQHQNGK